MNNENQIGIDKDLRDELFDNIQFKYELKDCIKGHIAQNWSARDGTKESKHKTCIGEITIYEDTKSGDILVVKSDKIKDRSSADTDKRQTQDHQ